MWRASSSRRRANRGYFSRLVRRYRSVRGMGEWQPLMDQRHYHRNLFAGLASAPPVAANARLIVADREREDAALADLRARRHKRASTNG